MTYKPTPEFERFYPRMIEQRFLELLEQTDVERYGCTGIDPMTPKGLGKLVGTLACSSPE